MYHRSTSLSSQGVCLCMALALVLQFASSSPAQRPLLTTHRLTKRSYFELECQGVYDKRIYARLDKICDDCYNLFREPELHKLCRNSCFTSGYFKGCIEALQLTDEVDQIQSWIKQLHGAEPGV